LKQKEWIKIAYEQYLCNYNCTRGGNEELTWLLQVEDDDEGVRLLAEKKLSHLLLLVFHFLGSPVLSLYLSLCVCVYVLLRSCSPVLFVLRFSQFALSSPWFVAFLYFFLLPSPLSLALWVFSSFLLSFVAFYGFFIKPYDGLCSCVRAPQSWGTNASVTLRRNRGITVLLLQDCSTWPLEDNGQLKRRSCETWPKTVLVSCWIGPWSGDEEGDEQWFKTAPFVYGNDYFQLGPWTSEI
jgi:hypothetical protein